MNTVPLDEHTWSLLLSRIHSEDCIPFLGAGSSLCFGDGRGLPTASELAKMVASECKYPGRDKIDLLRVSQYYAMVQDRYAIRQFIRKKLSMPDVKPSLVHNLIASMPFRIVLTTNFDNLMERAFMDQGKHPRVVNYVMRGEIQELKNPKKEEPLVYKLHGSLDNLDTMIVTEDDVVEFLACAMLEDPPLPDLIKGIFKNFSIIFIGYGLKDWNIRVMIRALRGKRRKSTEASDIACFAIQRRPKDPDLAKEWETSVMYWYKQEDLRCFDVKAVDFVKELKDRYEAEYVNRSSADEK